MPNLNKLPSQPGIYRFLDKTGSLLYIGKAKNLKNRIKSYFVKTAELTPAKKQMVAKIKKIQFTIVTNETEALLLERNLIKKYLPPFNVDLKDDKSWLYAGITKDEFPKVILTRRNQAEETKNNIKKYFGPYTSAEAIRQTMKMLKRLFPYYTANGPMVNLAKNPNSNFHLGRYLNQPSLSKTDWLKKIRQIKLFLAGKNDKLKKSLSQEMLVQAKKKNFEQAAILRNSLRYLEQISVRQKVIANNKVNEEYIEQVGKNFAKLEELQKILHLKNLPSRIECYDISNIQGNFAVGSMVVLIDAEIDKSQYRRFKIKTVIGANDPKMIGEVIKRRLKNNWPKPDLILIDGGPTQLNAAGAEIKKAGLKISLCSLAKKEEEIYLPGEKVPISLPKFSASLQLLQRIRDEAHRFAINYYRKLHSKNLIH